MDTPLLFIICTVLLASMIAILAGAIMLVGFAHQPLWGVYLLIGSLVLITSAYLWKNRSVE